MANRLVPWKSSMLVWKARWMLCSLSNDIWGYCYTQLTDVEQEQNGIYYYDRTPKFDMKRIHAIFSKTPDSK